MSRLLILLCVSLSVLQTVVALYDSDNTHVVSLDNDNFERQVKVKKGKWLIQFYKPDEKPCKKFAKEYERIAKAFNNILNVGAIDAEENPNLAGHYGVTEFPTIKFFTKEMSNSFTGELNARNITHFVIDQLESHTYSQLGIRKPKKKKDDMDIGKVYVFNQGNFEHGVFENDYFWVVLFHAPWCQECEALHDEFDMAAELDEVKGKVFFAKIDGYSEKYVVEKYGIDRYPKILMFPPNSKDNPVDFSEGRVATEIADHALGLQQENSRLSELNKLKDLDDLKAECLMASSPCLLAILDEGTEFEQMVVRAKMKQKKGRKTTYLGLKFGQSDDIEEMFNINDEKKIIGIDPVKKEYVYLLDKPNVKTIADFAKSFVKIEEGKRPIVLPKEDL